MNILSIGNSFSQDAQRYLHKIAKKDGVELNTANLYIGGCSLALHYENMISDKPAYALEINGESSETMISIKDALLSGKWDVVTLQQASHFSPYYDTYQPYISELAKYVRKYVPNAKIAIHQTWAYEQDSERLKDEMCYKNHTEMFRDIEASYNRAATEIKADFIITSGELFQKLLTNGIDKIHRDTFHASFGLGRYALGLLWYFILTGNNIEDNAFCDFDEEISPSQIAIIKKCILETTR